MHVAIVSHDAGGAEILSSWAHFCKHSFSLVLAGPALKIFKNKCPHAEILSLEEAIKKSDWVLCGTGWQTSFERDAIKYAKDNKKKVIAYLDHWVNYKERFHNGLDQIFPDEIWVADKYAEKIASNIFSDIPITLIDNPYLNELKTQIKKLSIDNEKYLENKKSILYVCEPKKEHAFLKYGDERYWGYTEDDALNYFYKNLKYINKDIKEIKVRLHPSEKKGKYDWFKNFNSRLIKIVSEESLIVDIINSDIIVGCESMALVVGLLANKTVISGIPPNGRQCQLPQKEIIHLRDLIASRQLNA